MQAQEADRGGQAALGLLALPVHAGKVMPLAPIIMVLLLLLCCECGHGTQPSPLHFACDSLLNAGCTMAAVSFQIATAAHTMHRLGLAVQARTLKRGHAWALLPLDPTAWLVMLSQHHTSLQQELTRQAGLEHAQPTLPGMASPGR